MGNLVGRVCLAGKLFCLLVPFHVWVGVVLCLWNNESFVVDRRVVGRGYILLVEMLILSEY